ncbi:MAG: tetratricopeptide repeat protein [Acidobacteria bacterium]|nr:tetratricopeptide repeat protein [Acidobacteriota bacterium]
MKRCPTCNRAEPDDALAFCRADGTPLVRVADEDAGTIRLGTSSAGDAGGARATDAPTTRLGTRAPAGNARRLAQPTARRGALVAALLLCAALAAGAYLYVSRGKGGAAKNSVAVLPFQNASGDPDMEYLSDGITENLINRLSQLPNVRVIARGTMFRFKGRDADAQSVGKQLGVDAVLTGRIVQRGDSLTVQADLVNVSDGTQAWGEQYSRKLNDIEALQGEIARDVSNGLRAKLSGAQERQLTKGETASPEAYQLYLRGRYYWNKRTEENVRKGVELFQQAIDKDPNFALAYVGIADSYHLLSIPDALTGAMPPDEAVPKARDAAERALAIDPTLAEAHASLAQVEYISGDWAGAEDGLRHSIELNPNYANAHHWYALNLASLGRDDEALREINRALELDPLSLPINTNVAFVLFMARRYDEAAEKCRKALDMDSTFALAHKRLALVYEQKGMYREAVAEFRQAADGSDDHPNALAGLAHALALSGDKGLN